MELTRYNLTSCSGLAGLPSAIGFISEVIICDHHITIHAEKSQSITCEHLLYRNGLSMETPTSDVLRTSFTHDGDLNPFPIRI